MKEGSKVRIVPIEPASRELQELIADRGRVVAEVLSISSLNVCTLQLPKGVTIPGFSQPLKNGHDYIDLHKKHLEEVVV